MATMKKALFIRTEKVARGDGKGPVFEKGKAYLMRVDSYNYWMGLGSIIDAPADMRAENEGAQAGLRPNDVIIKKVRGGKYHVYGPGEHRFTDEAVSAGEAEQIRREAIAGKITVPAAAAVAADQRQPESKNDIGTADVETEHQDEHVDNVEQDIARRR